LSSVQVATYNPHLGLLRPERFRVYTERVYSDRREADFVMASM
jgi:hypothetical protein